MTAQAPVNIAPPATSQLTELRTIAELVSAIASQENLAAVTKALEDKGKEADAKLAEAAAKLNEANEIARLHESTQAELDARLKAVAKEEERLETISKAVDKREAESVRRENDLNRMAAEFEARQNEHEKYLAERTDALGIKEIAAEEKMAQAQAKAAEAEDKLGKLQGIVNN